MRGKKQQAAAVEDPADKAARERERGLAQQERRTATEEGASGLTSDLRAIYGLRGYRGSMFAQGAAPAAAAKPAAAPAPPGSPMAFYNALTTPGAKIAASIFGAKQFGFPSILPAAPAAPPPDRTTGYTSPITNASKNNAMSGGTNNKNGVSTRSTSAPTPSSRYSANDKKGNAKKK